MSHIILVAERLINSMGGAQRVIIDIANTLSEKGHTVEIWHYEPPTGSARPYYTLSENVPFVSLFPEKNNKAKYYTERLKRKLVHRLSVKFPSKFGMIRHNLKYKTWGKRLAKRTQEANPDAVITFMPPAIAAGSYAMTFLDLPQNFIASTHNDPEQDYNNPNRWDPGLYARKRRIKDIRKYSKITVLLPEFQEWYKKNLNMDVFVMPNILHPTARINKSSGHTKNLIAVGRLSEAKSFDKLIKSWSFLREKHPDWTLQIFGDGPLRTALEKKAKSQNVSLEIFKGQTSNMTQVYKEASLMAHPATYEGFGLVVGEALSAGVPVVGNKNCPGVNTLIEHNANGLLVSFEQGEQEFIDALDDLMSSEQKRKRLSLNGCTITKKYGEDAIYEKWINLIWTKSK